MNITSVNAINQYNVISKSKTKASIDTKPKIERVDTVELSGKISTVDLERYKDNSFLNDPSFDSQFEKFIKQLF
jgi:hypothetical protein